MKQIRTAVFGVIFCTLLLAPSLAGAISFKAETVYQSVFVIYSGHSIGSGFAIGENCIISNAHVIEDPAQVTVVTYGADKYQANIIAIDKELDIVAIQVPDASFPHLKAVDPSACNIGDDIYAVGAPRSMSFTMTKGIVSAKERKVGRSTYIQIDAAINSGNSGGPLLNEFGEVLGMNTMKLSGSEGIGLAIPITSVCEFLSAQHIPLDDNGNVDGPITKPPVQTTIPQQAKNQGILNESVSQPTSDLISILYCIVFFSGVLNIVLLILLLRCKKALEKFKATLGRTEFEIEFLE